MFLTLFFLHSSIKFNLSAIYVQRTRRPRTSPGPDDSSSSSVCYPQAKYFDALNPPRAGGGGGGGGRRQPAARGTDMHVFQSDAGAGGEGPAGRGRGSPGGRGTSAGWSWPGPPAWWRAATGRSRCVQRPGGRGGLRAPAALPHGSARQDLDCSARPSMTHPLALP